MKTKLTLFSFLSIACIACNFASAAPSPWVTEGFDAFSKVTFDDSGANLHVTRAGVVKTTNRFDLNGDGFLDLVFNSSHDELRAIAPSAVAVAKGTRSPSPLSLPAYGTSAAVIADLNNDGLPEAILLPNHNGTTARRKLSIYWADENGWAPHRRTNLWTIEARALAVADLNNDGWPDIAILNGTRWAPEDGPEAVVRIYWGSPDGFRHDVRRDIPVPDAVDLAITDLDGDDRPDVAILQSNPARILVYWQKPDGTLSAPDTIPLGVENAIKFAIADLNADNRPDFVVAGGNSETLFTDPTTWLSVKAATDIILLHATPQPRVFAAPRVLGTPQIFDLRAADLDGDGLPEILLATRPSLQHSGSDKPVPGENPQQPPHQDGIRILWNHPSGDFSVRLQTTVPVQHASAIAVADIDGDGHADIAVGTARCEDTYQAESPVFFGDGKGNFHKTFTVPTAGVGGVTIASDAQQTRIIFNNLVAGRLREDIPVSVFYGGPDGFSPDRFKHYSIRSGYASSAADLNDDGHTDLVLLSIVHTDNDNHPGIGINILWGGPDGLHDDRRTVLPEYGVMGISIADTDRDGYLDIIVNSAYPTPKSLPGSPAEAIPANQPPRIAIWRGGPEGFSPARRDILPLDKGTEGQNLVADFNRDGYIDIAVAQDWANTIIIYWGGPEGFSPERVQRIPLVSANDMKAADLNGDGWLDLVVTSHRMRDTSFFDFGTTIYWGGPGGYSQKNAFQLPAQDGIGLSIADFDGDGYLDIFTPGYHYGHTREGVSAHLFWGGPDGYDDLRKTEFLQDGGHGVLAADFDGDGLIDIAIACHTRNGTHDTNSLVYFNDGNRFKKPRKLLLPTVGPHYMQRADVGSPLDRSYRQSFNSPVHTYTAPCRTATLRSTATLPGKTRVEFSTRSAPDATTLDKQPWRPVPTNGPIPLDKTDRTLQYRATLISDNGDRYPELSRVEITFNP